MITIFYLSWLQEAAGSEFLDDVCLAEADESRHFAAAILNFTIK